MSNKSIRLRPTARVRLRFLQSIVLGGFLAGSVSVGVGAPIVASAATVASSGSSQAFQHSAQDRVAYLHDGSLLVGYWNSATPAGAYVYHVTNPSTSPVSTQTLFVSGGDEVSIYTQPGGGSTEIWVAVGSELDGLPKLEQVQHGTYNGSTFTWDGGQTPTQIPGALTTGRQDPSLTWTGKWLISAWWDDTVGGNSDNIFYNWTTDHTGATGWNVMAKSGTVNAATLAAATTVAYNLVSGAAPVVGDRFQIGKGNNCPCDAELRQVTAVSAPVGTVYTLTVAALTNAHLMGEEIRVEANELSATSTNSVQVSIRHSAKLGATIAVYGNHCFILTRTLLDSAADPSPANWTTEAKVDTGNDDCEGNFGGPQIAIDESTGKIHVFKAVTNSNSPSWSGVTYWLGTPDATPMSSGHVSWSSRLIVDASNINATDPPDIAGAVDSTGKVYIFWATSVAGGAIKYVTLTSPYTSASAPITVATTGANPRYPHVPAQAPLTGGYVPLVYQSGTGPFNIVLDTSVPDKVAPTVPTGLNAANTNHNVVLTWNASTDNVGVTGYDIYRADHGVSPLATVSGSTLTYTDTTVAGFTTYTYTVDAFDAAGNHSAQSAPASITTGVANNCLTANLTTSPVSPGPTGGAVIMTGSSTGCPNPVYRFWIRDPGRAWSMVQDYSPSNTHTWTQTYYLGVTNMEVDVRDASESTVYDVVHNITFTTIGCTAANISFNPTSPQTHGTAVVFTGSSTCPGTGAQYRFWIFDPGRRWSMVKDYSASNTYNWAATSTLATGVYRIEVDVRDAGSGEVYEVVFNTTYTMT